MTSKKIHKIRTEIHETSKQKVAIFSSTEIRADNIISSQFSRLSKLPRILVNFCHDCCQNTEVLNFFIFHLLPYHFPREWKAADWTYEGLMVWLLERKKNLSSFWAKFGFVTGSATDFYNWNRKESFVITSRNYGRSLCFLCMLIHCILP